VEDSFSGDMRIMFKMSIEQDVDRRPVTVGSTYPTVVMVNGIEYSSLVLSLKSICEVL
jgi:hypothetical protein